MLGPFLVVVVLAVATVDSTAATSSTAQASATAQKLEQPWPPVGVSRLGAGSGIKAPDVIKEVKPTYTTEARKAKIQGIVEVEAIVQTDGTVGEVRVLRSLDRELGLDEAAVKAVKSWRFKPGTKDGVAVPVLVAIEMSFVVK